MGQHTDVAILQMVVDMIEIDHWNPLAIYRPYSLTPFLNSSTSIQISFSCLPRIIIAFLSPSTLISNTANVVLIQFSWD